MSDYITLKHDIFYGGVENITARTSEMLAVKLTLPDNISQSEVLADYIECVQAIHKTLNNYKSLLTQDIERIKNAGNAIQEADVNRIIQQSGGQIWGIK